MPACLTHYTFVKKNINNKDIYFSETCLGGQGPDVFFFYGYSFNKRIDIKSIREIGTYLHHNKIDYIYLSLVDYAKKSEHRDVLLAYLKGVFLHYILDRNMHPYIFYESGYISDNSKESATKFLVKHQYFESDLDYAYAKKEKTLFNPAKSIKTKKESALIISKMWFEVLSKIGITGIKEDSFYLSYLDMKTALGVLYSPLRIKKLIFKIFFKNTSVDALSFPISLSKKKAAAILNNSKEQWKDCVNGVNRDESVDELVNIASKEIDLLENLFNSEDLNAYELFFNNIDHDGFKLDAVKIYFKNTKIE